MYANAVEVWSRPQLSSTGPYGGVYSNPVCSSATWNDMSVSAGQRITSIVVKTRAFNGVLAVCGIQALYGGTIAGASNDKCTASGWGGATATSTT